MFGNTKIPVVVYQVHKPSSYLAYYLPVDSGLFCGLCFFYRHFQGKLAEIENMPISNSLPLASHRVTFSISRNVYSIFFHVCFSLCWKNCSLENLALISMRDFDLKLTSSHREKKVIAVV